MKSYTITAEEGEKLMSDCTVWFGKNTDILQFIRWLAGRCRAPTLSANTKLEAAADFLTKYFDLEHGFGL